MSRAELGLGIGIGLRLGLGYPFGQVHVIRHRDMSNPESAVPATGSAFPKLTSDRRSGGPVFSRGAGLPPLCPGVGFQLQVALH